MAAFDVRRPADMQTLVTPELTLEPLRAEHAEAMFEVLGDAPIYRHLDYAAPPSVEHLRGVYTRLEARRSPDGSDTWLNWVVRPHGKALVGYVQATVTSACDAYVAYVLASRYWGRGYAQGAVQAMLEHLAASYEVKQYLATVEVENHRSIRLLGRLGFQLTAERAPQAQRLAASERLFVRHVASKDKDSAHDRIA